MRRIATVRGLRPRQRWLLVAFALACSSLVHGDLRSADDPSAGGEETPVSCAPEAVSLERIARALEAELTLAESKDYYLVLEPEPVRMRLMHAGVLLHELEVRSMEVGTPRVLFARRSDPDSIYDRAWRHGRLVPPRERIRTEIDTSPDSTDEVPIPPLPEELYPTPERFFVRYPGGLALEVAPDSATAGPGWGRRVSDLFATIKLQDRWRVRLKLDPEEVGRLYRSFPDSCAVLIMSTPWRRDDTAKAGEETKRGRGKAAAGGK